MTLAGAAPFRVQRHLNIKLSCCQHNFRLEDVLKDFKGLKKVR
jgi:hypothetical protein